MFSGQHLTHIRRGTCKHEVPHFWHKYAGTRDHVHKQLSLSRDSHSWICSIKNKVTVYDNHNKWTELYSKMGETT